MGVTWKDSLTVGNLLGTRMVLNEFVAFAKLGEPGVGSSLDPRSLVITTFALCGFANFSSIAIQIGGIGSLAPSRRGDLARLGLRAMFAGTLANFLTATIAGMLFPADPARQRPSRPIDPAVSTQRTAAITTAMSSGTAASNAITRPSRGWGNVIFAACNACLFIAASAFCRTLSGMPRHCGPE